MDPATGKPYPGAKEALYHGDAVSTGEQPRARPGLRQVKAAAGPLASPVTQVKAIFDDMAAYTSYAAKVDAEAAKRSRALKVPAPDGAAGIPSRARVAE